MNRKKSRPSSKELPSAPSDTRKKVRKTLYRPETGKAGSGSASVREACPEYHNAEWPKSVSSFGRMITRTSALAHVLSDLRRVADSSATVLLNGETGTGKELAARALHETGMRRSRPFIAINCGSLTPSLVESELFGYEKDAFTGANARRAGAFESANGGTLFLDEIGELPLDLQPRLLRVLDAGEVRRVGSTAPFHADVRVVASTNRDLAEAVRAGQFREDLYFRLCVVKGTIPPLRERFDDLSLLISALLQDIGSNVCLSAGAMKVLRSHDWPGNVRELKNVLTRASLFCNGNEITAEAIDIPKLRIRAIKTLAEVERGHTLDVLRLCGDNRTAAAHRLGISRSGLFDRLRRYQVMGDRPGA